MSKITVNLLPDSKQERLRRERSQKITKSISIATLTVAFSIVMLLFGTVLVYNKRIETVQKQIDAGIATLKNDESLQKNLTIQSQIQGIDDLETEKIFATNIFEILEYSIIEGSTISSIQFSKETGSYEIKGQSDSFELLDSQVKSIKAMQFTQDDLSDIGLEKATFTEVYGSVISTSYSIDSSQNVFYTIEGTINPIIVNDAITALRLDPDTVGDLITLKPIYIIGQDNQLTDTFEDPDGGNDE